eukprot:1181191-Prorocentrum_minimum.AAC.1
MSTPVVAMFTPVVAMFTPVVAMFTPVVAIFTPCNIVDIVEGSRWGREAWYEITYVLALRYSYRRFAHALDAVNQTYLPAGVVDILDLDLLRRLKVSKTLVLRVGSRAIGENNVPLPLLIVATSSSSWLVSCWVHVGLGASSFTSAFSSCRKLPLVFMGVTSIRASRPKHPTHRQPHV